MLFYSFFKTLVGKEVCDCIDIDYTIFVIISTYGGVTGKWPTNETQHFSQQVTIELKNDLCVTGILHSVDQYLNVKLNNIKVQNSEKYPHMLSVKNCFIRGSVVRYIQVCIRV